MIVRQGGKMRNWTILLIVIFLGGCTSLRITQPIKKFYKNYSINELQHANIGDSIIEIENAKIRDAYIALIDYQTPTIGIQGSQQIFINKNDRFTKVAEFPNNSNDIFIKKEEPRATTVVMNIFTNGKIHKGWVLIDGTVPVQGNWITEQIFEFSDISSRSKNSFKSQIIYSGITGNTLRAVYREYAEDYARPAFSQELQYNLDESKIISYKSIQIEIIEATNSYVKYKVIDDGGIPWFPK